MSQHARIRLGIAEAGLRHTMSQAPSLDEQFRLLRESGVFTYLDKTPPRDRVAEYARLSERHGVPILAGGWWYTLGRDEALLEENLRIGASLGSLVHNVQILMDHADGRLVSDTQVAEAYLRAYDLGAALGCLPSLEIHINMWSEDFRRVAGVGRLVEARGIPFRLTLDHSHVIFKIDNPRELAVFGLEAALRAGEIVLDPFAPGSVCAGWISAGWVAHGHARSTVPNNPRNVTGRHASLEALPSSRHPRELVGRGVQYPFVAPRAGEWHASWDAAALEPWKEVVRQLVAYHRTHEASPLRLISTEFIPFTDYGEGGGYSLLENSIACARWIEDLLNGPVPVPAVPVVDAKRSAESVPA